MLRDGVHDYQCSSFHSNESVSPIAHVTDDIILSLNLADNEKSSYETKPGHDYPVINLTGNIHDGNTRPRKCYPSTCSKWDKNQLMERESLTRLPTCAPGCGYHLNNFSKEISLSTQYQFLRRRLQTTAFQWNRLIDWEPCHLWEVLYGDAVVQQNCCLYRRATEPCSKAIFWKYHLVLKVLTRHHQK